MSPREMLAGLFWDIGCKIVTSVIKGFEWFILATYLVMMGIKCLHAATVYMTAFGVNIPYSVNYGVVP